jgi:DNA-binding protein HU-beta
LAYTESKHTMTENSRSTYGKPALVRDVATTTGLTQKQVEAVITAALDTVQQKVQGGQSVTLSGFGTFSIKERAERAGVNPQTGQRITIAPGQRAHWKPSATFLKPTAPTSVAREPEQGLYARESGR